MDKEEIRKLEPKYIGNTRHLTEGEAGEIMHDPANEEDDDNDALSGIALASLAFAAHESGNTGGGGTTQ
ncbi:hypothetical protein [Paenibacillus mesotrionivorans]|jgi:hypothetical protein|uniref:Uncharacterized protein n=1 Tax=Paenibacillus mesotrionivorans TaxID=3160968 RepID=A0ACC7NU80_9BACL